MIGVSVVSVLGMTGKLLLSRKYNTTRYFMYKERLKATEKKGHEKTITKYEYLAFSWR
jgi:hypothetical protein